MYYLQVRKLLNQICQEWNSLKDTKEIEIVKRYGTFTRRLTEALLRKKLPKTIVFDVDRFTTTLFSKFTSDIFRYTFFL